MMGAKTKLPFPVIQPNEPEAKTCECPQDGHYLAGKNGLKCKDTICHECLRKIANPRAAKYGQRLCNIPILCHIQSMNVDNKRSDFQRLLKAQRNSRFVDLLPQSRVTATQYPVPAVDDVRANNNFPIFGSMVTPDSLKRSFGNIPSYIGRQSVPSIQSYPRVTSGPQPAVALLSVESANGDKVSVDDCAKSRIKDCDGFIRRAACVCVNEDETKLVLVSSKNDGGGWLIPGGGLEDGEEEIVAAKREAWEEAGIKGRITRWLGVFQCEDETAKKKKKTSVFVLRVSEEFTEFPEANLGRVRRWFDVCEARKLLSICKPSQMSYLDALIN